jgi:hypothetical protein
MTSSLRQRPAKAPFPLGIRLVAVKICACCRASREAPCALACMGRVGSGEGGSTFGLYCGVV